MKIIHLFIQYITRVNHLPDSCLGRWGFFWLILYFISNYCFELTYFWDIWHNMNKQFRKIMPKRIQLIHITIYKHGQNLM